MRRVGCLAVLAAACGGGGDGGAFTIFVAAEQRAVVDEFVDSIPIPGLRVETKGDPAAAVEGGGGGIRVAAIAALVDCDGCFRIDGEAGRYVVNGGGVLGMQYGLAQLFEDHGVRFRHPLRTTVPAELATPSGESFGRVHAPDRDLRGIHFHTLHPIEAYFDLWETGPDAEARALRLLDWVVKNRGNYVEWAALADVVPPGERQDAWRAHSARILEDAHRRGVQVGIGIQLFAGSNLQRAFVLVDDPPPADLGASMRDRFHVLLDGLPFDRVSLGFGEFFGADPDAFVAGVNLAYDTLQEVAPGTVLTALLHVGADLRVDYMGENLPYYFLVKFCNPAIVHWVHTVMFYNLYEDAGLAYESEDFSEQRAYLEARLAAGQPVGYQPESAYWIAFDDSVPVYLPLYVRSRWLDLSMLPTLEEHVEFSSGAEWGYWQNDAAALRLSYELTDRWDRPFEDWFDARLVGPIADLGELEHDYLLERRLMPWIAGRDVTIDVGDSVGIHSQPDRLSYAEIAAMTPEDRALFADGVVTPLAELTDGLEAIRAQVALAGAGSDDPFVPELLDGIEATAARAHFAHDLTRAVVEWAEGRSPDDALAAADESLAAGQVIVARRHAALHDPEAARLVERGENFTLYPSGYLHFADDLCYWERERVEARNLIFGMTGDVPPCFDF